MYAIETCGLVKKFGTKTAVNGLDLAVNEGELFGLLGVNGAGKTTTIRILTGLSLPTSGKAYIMGKDVVAEDEQTKELTNVSPQETAVAPKLTVRENLMFMAEIYGYSGADAKARVDKMREQFRLDDVMEQKAATLSGGWQRKLSIALALISEPRVLFLDEPTLGLDVLARRELWKTIEAMKGKITVVLTTHYLEEAEALCDRIAVMAGGNLMACDTSENIIFKTGKKNFEEAFISLVGGEDVL